MRLEEAIDHLEEMLADENHEWSCVDCREEHEQLLGWLKELKGLRLENKVMYLCDRKKPCKEHCEKYHHCKHTSDITHAKNFKLVPNVDPIAYEEVDEHCIANITIDQERLKEIVDEAMADVYRWIPVSERYPEEEENYLVTIKFGDKNIIQVARFSHDLSTVDPVGVDMQGEEYKRPGFWIHESEYGFSSLNVIAWKNLPIAYKGEDGRWVRP